MEEEEEEIKQNKQESCIPNYEEGQEKKTIPEEQETINNNQILKKRSFKELQQKDYQEQQQNDKQCQLLQENGIKASDTQQIQQQILLKNECSSQQVTSDIKENHDQSILQKIPEDINQQKKPKTQTIKYQDHGNFEQLQQNKTEQQNGDKIQIEEEDIQQYKNQQQQNTNKEIQVEEEEKKQDKKDIKNKDQKIKTQLKKQNQKHGIEIFVDIDGTLFNDPSLHVSLLYQIKSKSVQQYEEIMENQSFLNSLLKTENLLRPSINDLLFFFYETKKTFPFIKFSIFTSNPQLKSYEKIIKHLEKNIKIEGLFDNYIMAEKLGKKYIKDIQYHSEYSHSYILDNNNTCTEEQIQNLIPIKTFSALEYLSEENRQFYLKYFTPLQLDSIIMHKNEKHVMQESANMFEKNEQDWRQEIQGIIQQFQMIIDNVIMNDQELQKLLK